MILGDEAMSVTHNVDKNRYELVEEGEVAFAAYKRNGDVWDFNHTVVPKALGGRGIGTRLVEAALADVKAAGGRVIPSCSFVERYLEKHPDAAELA